MSTPRLKSFSPEVLAQVAVVVLLQPCHLSTQSFSSAVRIAHNLLVAAENFNAERAAAFEAAKNAGE